MNLLMQESAPAVVKGMTAAGWISLALSLGFVVTLVTWCYRRVLTAPPADDS